MCVFGFGKVKTFCANQIDQIRTKNQLQHQPNRSLANRKLAKKTHKNRPTKRSV